MDVDSTGGNEVAEAKKVAVVAKNVDAAKKAAKAKEAHKAKEAGKSKEAAGGKSADDKTLRKLKKKTGDIPEKFKRGTPKDIAAKNRPRDSGAVTVGSASTAKKKPMRKQPPSKRLKKA
ncbi:hypothetical protein GGH13_008409 [Coemansia sp. S155-1]|nr:hypothetical protein GGH13_008409 [Coemansia sp. S155-1]